MSQHPETLEEQVAEFERAWREFLDVVAESLHLPALAVWLDRKIGGARQ